MGDMLCYAGSEENGREETDRAPRVCTGLRIFLYPSPLVVGVATFRVCECHWQAIPQIERRTCRRVPARSANWDMIEHRTSDSVAPGEWHA